MATVIRLAEPGDHARVVAVVDEWWGGRAMAAMLPKLFFVHFRDTSFVAEDDEGLAGFLCGFRSQTHDDEAYVHFIGVDPGRRGSGLGRALYERFFEAVAPRTIVRAVTSPANERSVAFHQAIGFEIDRVDEDYDGRGEARVLLVKNLTSKP
jgi:ribosomal protein S18 acetylase RimI-like enzyme